MSENRFLQITSLQNELVKETAKLQLRKHRKESPLILLEGEKSVFEALEAGISLKYVLCDDSELLNKISKQTNAA